MADGDGPESGLRQGLHTLSQHLGSSLLGCYPHPAEATGRKFLNDREKGKRTTVSLEASART